MMGGAKGMLIAGWACILLAGWGAPAKLGRAVFLGPNVVSLGVYPNTEDRTVRVGIRNEGNGDLRLEHVIGTCKCMRVQSYPRVIAPGKTGQVAVSILKDEVSGAYKHVFFIETSDPECRNIKVRIEGYATPPFLVTCDTNSALGVIGEELVWTGRYTLAATDACYSLGVPVAQECGTQSSYTLQTNGETRLTYEVTRRVALTGVGRLESSLVFPICSKTAKAPPPVRLTVNAYRRTGERRRRESDPPPTPSP